MARYELKALLDTLESLHAAESGEPPGQARKPTPGTRSARRRPSMPSTGFEDH